MKTADSAVNLFTQNYTQTVIFYQALLIGLDG